jgi:hypothetical protein
MESLSPFLQGTCTPYNTSVYPGARSMTATALGGSMWAHFILNRRRAALKRES